MSVHTMKVSRRIEMLLHSFLPRNWMGIGSFTFALPMGKRQAGRLRLKCDSTRAETKFRLSAKRMSPFK
jgi:hypothetical protein